MVIRTVNAPQEEPGEMKVFERPSEKEHLFFVTDVLETIDPDPNIIHVKLEVNGGDEEGRTILNRINLDENWKGFFATQLFLKAIGEPYKGDNITIDTDKWIAKQFYATVVHNGKYANIGVYNFDKSVEKKEDKPAHPDDIAWDE